MGEEADDILLSFGLTTEEGKAAQRGERQV